MPFLSYLHQTPPLLINTAHVVALLPKVGQQNTPNGMGFTVTILTSRPELDRFFEFSSEFEATDFMDGITSYMFEPEFDALEIHNDAYEVTV